MINKLVDLREEWENLSPKIDKVGSFVNSEEFNDLTSKDKAVKFSKGSVINGVTIDEMNNAEKEALIAKYENRGTKVIIEGYNDNDE